ncbi:hypothetical protein EPA93_04475 [Ktedonosporobacter rubrisoli]|uniref:Multidrug efflux SMR transporter n=1 Tax=Ktedonosporobacter rubrisoli TaxID=2509675 RepID=A0A4P6JK10_KTERU|nr:SMR family transporter [Ktedonosporobacter rubrisoli]QBD75292.1 hypothetical protein EPA93_04475 [Ktedonosporobacter rubrisoli]
MKKKLAWPFVIIGGALEIVWASGFKYEAIPPIVVLVALLVSFDLFVRACKVIPVGTAYAVFVGMGTIGTTIVEGLFSAQSFNLVKVPIILFLLLCLVGLKLTSGEGAH